MSDATTYELPTDDLVNNMKSDFYGYLENLIHDDFDDNVLKMQLDITRHQLLLKHFSVLPSNSGITIILDGYADHLEDRLKQICDILELGDPNTYPITFKFRRFIFMEVKNAASIPKPNSARNLWLACVRIYDFLNSNLLVKSH